VAEFVLFLDSTLALVTECYRSTCRS